VILRLMALGTFWEDLPDFVILWVPFCFNRYMPSKGYVMFFVLFLRVFNRSVKK